jgi:Skp family chaperone for outer membrane proteins
MIIKKTLALLVLVVVCAFSLNAMAQTVKTVAIGDVEAGYDTHGRKPADVKETIQILMKKRLEKLGKGAIQANIVSPAVVVEGSQPKASNFPTLPTNRAPTQKEMAQYMAAIQQWQKQATGQVKTFKPASEQYYVDFSVSGGKSGMDTSGIDSTIGQFGGSLPTDIADVGTKSVKVDLICTMRNPQTGALVDRYVAKASSVKVKNLAGYTSYDYGNDAREIESLFNSAVKKCAKWMVKNIH